MTEDSSLEPQPADQRSERTDKAIATAVRKVAVVGEIPFAGRAVAKALTELGISVRVLCPDSSCEAALKSLPQASAIEIVEGDVGTEAAVSAALIDVHSVCFVSPISMNGRMHRDKTHIEDVRRVIRSAETHAVQRLVYHSAVGANASAQARALRDSAAAEELVSNARCGNVRLRTAPLMGRGDQFLSEIVRRAKTAGPFMNMSGYGGTLVQPLAVEDFAKGVAEILTDDKLSSGLYGFVGPETRSLLELTDSALSLTRRFKIKLHTPLSMLRLEAVLRSNSPFAERVNLLFDAHAIEQNDAEKLLGTGVKLATPLEVERKLLAG